MGIVRSKISKTFTNTFRGETRMLKEVSKEKPTQAPRHPSTEEAFKTLVNGINIILSLSFTCSCSFEFWLSVVSLHSRFGLNSDCNNVLVIFSIIVCSTNS